MIEEKIQEDNKLLLIKSDRLFKDMFNETQMDTLEWSVMQILNAKYEDIHGKVSVLNKELTNSFKSERNKTVDLLVDYDGCDILIELNNNYAGNYMRNMLYAFNIILHHYHKGLSNSEIIKKRVKLILVNLNWYPKNSNYNKVKSKEESYVPYPEDNTNDYLIRTISVNLDRYKNICYDKINEWDKLWKLLTIEKDSELEEFTNNEKLLKQYQKQLTKLSKDEGYKMILMDETIEKNALFDQTYGVGYRKGIEEGIVNRNEMIINMYNDKLPIESISKYANLSIQEVEEIIKQNN